MEEQREAVAPLAGAWIEIVRNGAGNADRESLPSRERGLKSRNTKMEYSWPWVAPLAGAWIEMYVIGSGVRCFAVAPLAGAWIEICFFKK